MERIFPKRGVPTALPAIALTGLGKGNRPRGRNRRRARQDRQPALFGNSLHSEQPADRARGHRPQPLPARAPDNDRIGAQAAAQAFSSKALLRECKLRLRLRLTHAIGHFLSDIPHHDQATNEWRLKFLRSYALVFSVKDKSGNQSDKVLKNRLKRSLYPACT
jgi:hypothetical protein